MKVYATVEKMNLDMTKLDPAHPLTLRLEDLEKAAPQPPEAEYWLKEATITVIPATYTHDRLVNGKPVPTTFSYYLTVQLQHDWTCKVAASKFPLVPNIFCSSPSGTWGVPEPR